ncbi:MAG: trypsin-like serine protease [Pseudomonadota bacterium]
MPAAAITYTDANVALAFGEEFPSVGEIRIRADGSVTEGVCSGTLVAPTIVVSAEHCFRDDNNILTDSDPNTDPGETLYTVTIDFGDGRRTVDTINTAGNVSNQTPTSDTLLNGTDIAVLQLTMPVTDIAPSTIFDGTLVEGDDNLAIVGFGRFGDDNGFDPLSQNPLDSQRRAAGNAFDLTGRAFGNIQNDILITDFDDFSILNNTNNNLSLGGGQRSSSSRFPLRGTVFGSVVDGFVEGNSAPGDSGGGVFVYLPDEDAFQIVAVVSGGQSPSGAGSQSFHTPFYFGDNRAFVDGFIAAAELNEIPLPASILMLGVGLISLSGMRAVSRPGRR